MASCLLVFSISARVPAMAALARLSAASASSTASDACCVFSGSLACCAARSCSFAPRSTFSYCASDCCWISSLSLSRVIRAVRPETLVSTSLMPAVASLKRLSATEICFPKLVMAALPDSMVRPAASQLVWARRSALSQAVISEAVCLTAARAPFSFVWAEEKASAAFCVDFFSATCWPSSFLTSAVCWRYSSLTRSRLLLAAMVAESVSPSASLYWR